MLFCFASEEDDPEIDRLFKFGGQFFQHRHAAADMESADGHRDAPRAELARDRHSAGELIGLNPGQADEAGMARLRHAPNDTLDGDLDGHLVEGVDLDRDIFTQRLPAGAVLSDGIHASH